MTRQRVRELLDAGFTQAAVARRLALSQGTVSYHARNLGVPTREDCARRYCWPAVQEYYDAGHSVSDCVEHFGMARKSFTDAVRRGASITRPQATPIEQLLATGRHRGRWNLKRRLLSHGLKDGRCEDCGISEWRGRALSLALHHVNGDGRDNRLENLRLLCPNCHSQTDNFAGRGVGRASGARG
ncbi:MAG: hypothetical protein QOD53_1848 [Thermoleophilaceae bacterium]|jgi:hypothetical protein|nr:hypothetical protein [Thermoleophilaceae bacterium]